MANDWKIKRHDVAGGQSGRLLDGCQIRRNADGTVDFLGVLATTNEEEGFQFAPFTYRGLIWNIDVDNFDVAPDQIGGLWGNNAPHRGSGTPQAEDGTYTAQAGSGAGGEEDCKEDAASASA